jgi:ribonuclease HI
MFFKGMSVAEDGDSGSGFSGIGVVMERTKYVPVIQVQKKLDFYVDESVADYLALMDGLAEAMQNNIRRVYAFTDSELLYDQVSLSLDMIFASYFYNVDKTYYDCVKPE